MRTPYWLIPLFVFGGGTVLLPPDSHPQAPRSIRLAFSTGVLP